MAGRSDHTHTTKWATDVNTTSRLLAVWFSYLHTRGVRSKHYLLSILTQHPWERTGSFNYENIVVTLENGSWKDLAMSADPVSSNKGFIDYKFLLFWPNPTPIFPIKHTYVWGGKGLQEKPIFAETHRAGLQVEALAEWRGDVTAALLGKALDIKPKSVLMYNPEHSTVSSYPQS